MAVFYNQASLTYSGGRVNSNVASGEIVESLSATKTAVSEEYTLGTEVTYALNIINSGLSTYDELTVTDDLGAYVFGELTLTPLDLVENSVKYFVDGVLQSTPTVTQTSPLVIDGITVPANGTATLLYSVRVNEYANPTETGTIVNTATVSGSTTEISASATINAAAGSGLEILKTVSPSSVAENEPLTYTFLISNSGNTAVTALDNAVLDDTFDPVLDDITVTYNGARATTPDAYSYDESTGVFSTTPGWITVPAATFVQDAATGVWTVTPGTATLTVTGTV